VILDTKGNIFGGLTPVKWESPVWNGKDGDKDNRLKADDSLKSFVFALNNPYKIPAKRFQLMIERKDVAIVCDSTLGSRFCDFSVSENCSANTDSLTYLDSSYTNDTGLSDEIVITGSEDFEVEKSSHSVTSGGGGWIDCGRNGDSEVQQTGGGLGRAS
jgi:hypothetical protein